MRHATVSVLFLVACSSSSSKSTDAASSSDGAGGNSGADSGSTGGTGGSAGLDARDSGGADTSGIDGAPPGNGPLVLSSGGPGIRIFELDMTTGALTARGKTNTTAGARAGYLAWTSDRKYVYADSDQKVVAYALDKTTLELTKINDATAVTTGGLVHVFVHKSDRWLLTSSYGSGEAAVLPIEATGGVAAPTDMKKPIPQNAHQIMTDIAGKFVFIPATGPNLVVQYALDTTLGKLTPNTPPTVSGEPNAEPRHIAFHPGEKFAYTINEANTTVTAYAYDATTGRLTPIETVSALPMGTSDTPDISGAHILVHPSGKFVYASTRGGATPASSIAVFSVDATTGRLTKVENQSGGGAVQTPRDFGMDPTGAYLVVGSQGTNRLVVLSIDGVTGKLTMVGAPTAVPDATYVGVMARP